MSRIITGTAFVFADNIDTDQIYPGRFVELTEEQEIAKHAMAGVDPDFVKEFRAGDIIVAAANFGCGSSREHAAICLKTLGIGAIVAESFARIFYRNATNLGIPLLVCPNVSTMVAKGDVLSVDLSNGSLVNSTKQAVIQAEPMSAYAMQIVAGGGIKALIKQRLTAGLNG